MEHGRLLKQKHIGIQPALPLWAALVEAISQAPDEQTRRMLQGLTLILIGKSYSPPKGVTRAQLQADVIRDTI
jgi:hypothetical protein